MWVVFQTFVTVLQDWSILRPYPLSSRFIPSPVDRSGVSKHETALSVGSFTNLTPRDGPPYRPKYCDLKKRHLPEDGYGGSPVVES